MGKQRRKLTMYTPTVFRIRVQGVLDESLSTYFGSHDMLVEEDETASPVTVFTSEPLDQSALAGLIGHLNVLGLPLMSVEYVQHQGCLS